MPQPQPGQLDHDVTLTRIAGFGDALLPVDRAAPPRRRYQPSIGGHITPIGEASVEAFMIKYRANLRTNCLEPREQCDRRRPPVHICLDGYIAFSLDISDLLQQQFDAGESVVPATHRAN